jgi:predicted dehydrogenase
MKPLRAAVIGTGYLGRWHSHKYAALEGVELSAVVDIDAAQAEAVAKETSARAITDYRELIGEIDMASIVVPTAAHYSIARELLEAGVHVLVEKPVTSTVAEARELVKLAEQRGRILQVGHLERFNPTMQVLSREVKQPLFIESHRVAPFKKRGTDISVIMDLMIHDIDLVLDLVNSPIAQIDASGASVLSEEIDIANARLRFESGCVANITASRVSMKSERRMRFFQRDGYYSADLSHHTLDIREKQGPDSENGEPSIHARKMEFEKGDPLMEEIRDFADCVRNGRAPLVGGIDGLRALETADEVMRQILQNNPGVELSAPSTPD